ncbi:unnamed protein product [Owenia fusiformis]|uniref:Uncharacterized protein n=1 Tax=Owenia fusiformis TaxID=6347 RepID=A0A8J1TLH8_OWEFU|nr:unnamed protein product [Owenia fusiformis]
MLTLCYVHLLSSNGDPLEELSSNGSYNSHVGYNVGNTSVLPVGKCQVLFVESNITKDCPWGWKYEMDLGENNIISEWDLVCNKKTLASLSTTIYFVGVMIGGVLFGTLSDRFGRKPLLLFTLYLPVGIGVGIAFSNSYWLFVFLRFIQGFLLQGLQTISYTMISEMAVPEIRSVTGTMTSLVWGTAVMLSAFVSYLIKDWRYIQLALTLPSVVTIIYIWVVPESLRWLIAKKKFKEAEEILKKAARFNNVTIPEDPFNTKQSDRDPFINGVVSVPDREESVDSEENNGKRERRYHVVDMCRTPNLRQRSIIMFYIWFAASVGYYGLSLSISTLAGSKYLNFFISGAVEIPAYILAMFVLRKYGRRIPLCVYFVIGGISCTVGGILTTDSLNLNGEGNLDMVATGFALVGKFGQAGTFAVIFLYSSELYPTVIRNVGIGACAFWARLGGVVAPQINLLGLYTFNSLPIIVFGVLSLAGGFLTLLLPETHKRKLPDTIEEAEDLNNQSIEELPKARDKRNININKKETPCDNNKADVEMNLLEGLGDRTKGKQEQTGLSEHL